MNAEQKPSEHAMRAAKELGGGDIEAYLIDQHAIAPAVFELHGKLTKRYQESLSKCHARLEERDKRIAELESTLEAYLGYSSIDGTAERQHLRQRLNRLLAKKGQP